MTDPSLNPAQTREIDRPIIEARDTMSDGHDHTRDCDCLPIRVVVDQHGHYWRDYGDGWSMCPVSDENTATEPVTEFYRVGGDLDASEVIVRSDELAGLREAITEYLAADDDMPESSTEAQLMGAEWDRRHSRWKAARAALEKGTR